MPLTGDEKRAYNQRYWQTHKDKLREKQSAHSRLAYFKEYNAQRGPDLRSRPYRKTPRCVDRIIGIDGEGQGRRPHLYTYMAAADEQGYCWEVANEGKQLTTKQGLDFLLTLPRRTLVVAYAFNYDLTKILTDIDNNSLRLLFNEKSRAYRDVDGKIRYATVKWRGYRLDYMNRRFTVAKGSQRTTVWDVWRFFQGKFTKALTDWKVGSQAEIDEIERMKDQRSFFDKLSSLEVQEYCKSECRKLAQLARALIDAHEDAGLRLKSYYGSGSTSSALLNKLEIKQWLKPPLEAMRLPIAMAFFGGRFENSMVGPIERKVYNYDISSAYPYQITFLPCLLHGKWYHETNPRIESIESASLALIHWHLHPSDHRTAWGPFPVRSEEGTITFPKAASGGWCWKAEYLSGQRLFPNVTSSQAWLYRTSCDCQPFKDIPYYYIERCKLGKGGKGDVFKSGPNGVYGKLAQSKGINPPFQSWIYAGNITSGTRAQLLDAFERGDDLWHILMFATDSVSSLQPLNLPAPRFTGTDITGKPLGGWECKEFPSGVFCVRPGIWFPLNPTSDELKEVRARGLGKKVMYENIDRIQETWQRSKTNKPIIITGRHKDDCLCGKCPEGLTRFVGAKSAISFGKKSGAKRSADYGEWVAHTIQVSFSPKPKRETILSDYRLKVWDYISEHSVPYDSAIQDPEVVGIDEFKKLIEEQPDLDLSSDY